MEFLNKYEYFNYFKKLLNFNGIEVSKYKEIKYGLQFSIIVAGQVQHIRVYESKKNGVSPDFSLVTNEETHKLLLNLDTEEIELHEIEADAENGEISLPKSFSIDNSYIIENIKRHLSDIGAKREKPDLKYKDEVYTIHNAKITIFVSGKVLIQGKPSKGTDRLYNDILLIIKKVKQDTFKVDIQDYFADLQDYSDFFEEADEVEEENICYKGEDFLGRDLFYYLNVNDQITMLDAVELFEFAKDKKIKFKNYAIIVINFAIAFEGFLIKIFIDSGILSEEDYKADVRAALGSKLSSKVILDFIVDRKRNEAIAINLEYVWKQHRNKNLHSDFLAPKLIERFDEAEHDVIEVRNAMRKCYEVLDFEKMNINKISHSLSNGCYEIQNVRTEEALSKLVREGYDIKQQKNANWVAQKGSMRIVNINNSTLKVIAPTCELEKHTGYFDEFINKIDLGKAEIDENSIIGTDESGKGDYFGPLVIAGVYADENVKKELKKLGVIDSKKLNDVHIALLASKIKAICKYTIVVIGNPKYNELYLKVGNLNKLLAWGHARVIENILEETNCEIALSDQFGNPELIENALMSKGKKILLEQRPRAEENVVVAAASILARNEFVERMKNLSEKYKIDFPKGASNSTVEVAKEFIKIYGKENLSAVAKLHFKNTLKL